MIVRLSNLKFAERWNNDPTLRPGAELHFTDQESTEPRRIDTYLSFSSLTEPDHSAGHPSTTHINEQNNSSTHKFKYAEGFYDRLSKDKLGEELSHDATIWKLYRSEAEEYDQELVRGRHASLDVLLLFAALFSAILTAFLVESKDLLQPDPAGTTAALLLMIAQHQINGSVDPSATVQPPPFSPTTSALWINGLWFAALALSLAAALVAMLSKEWLTAYTESRPRPAHTHSLLRQALFDGLNSWWALHIIALLPTLLHLSLLLFALGLVVYLWSLDVAVAAVTCAIIALTVVFYLATTLLGAIFPFCPFVTEISRYLQRTFESKLGKWFDRERYMTYSHREHKTTTLEDIRAVSWLAENARDPITIDCSYQALAGIRLPTELTTPTNQPSDFVKRWYRSLGSIFPTMLTRFKAVIRDGQELASSRGANAARYVRALVELSEFLDACDKSQPLQAEDGIRPKLESLAFASGSDASTSLPTARRSELALEALNGAWQDDHPPFSADVFASLTAAELRLVALTASPQKGPAPPLDVPEAQTTGPTPHATTINMTEQPTEWVSLTALRATYNRSLVRAAIQLRYHADGRTPIGPFALVKLLDALQISAECAIINPENNTETSSTENPEPRTKKEESPAFVIPVFSFEHYLRPTDLVRGPLGALIRVLGMTAPHPHGTGAKSSTYTDARFKVRLSTARSLAALAPILLKRWMLVKVSRSGHGPAQHEITPTLDPEAWPWPEIDANDSARLDNAITYQLLRVIRTVGPHIERAGAVALVEMALAEMDRIARVTPYNALLALRRQVARDFTPLLEYAVKSGSAREVSPLLSATAKVHILNLLTFEVPAKSQIRRTHLPAPYILHLLRITQDLPLQAALTRTVLKYVVDRARDTHNSLDYLRIFTHSDQGFSALVTIGHVHESYVEIVVGAILQISHIAISHGEGPRHDRIIVDTSAVSGLLEAISLVVRHTAQGAGRHNNRHLHSFVRNMLSALHRIDPEAARLVLEHRALDELIHALQAVRGRSESDLLLPESTSKTKRHAGSTNEYLLTQLRAFKEERLKELAFSRVDTGEGEPS